MKKWILFFLMLFFSLGSVDTFARVDVASQSFNLGPVEAVWNQDDQTLFLQGQGKIEKLKWQSLVSELGLKNQGTEEVEINFGKEVRFPDDASGFFMNFQSKHITFDPEMDTSNVTHMNNMFRGAVNFNQNLENWNVQNLQTAASMFNGATSFNGDINWKNLTKLNSINAMFKGAKNFNKPLDKWNTSTITDMSSTFDGASNFNQDIGMWKTQNVTKMYAMFQDAEQFNQNIGSWDTSSVTTMQAMFRRAKVFNQDLSNWKTGKVTNISNLFEDAEAFQGKGVKNWEVNSVTRMVQTFSNALAFNEDISEWTLEALEDGNKFIYFWKPGTPSFSRENHDKLLEEWSKKLGKSTKEIPLTIDAPYCLSTEAISRLRRKNYKHSTKYQRDCELKASESENKESKKSIKSTVTITSVLPADKITANISAEKTNITYKDWKCETIKADSPSIKECSFEVTSTEGGRNLEISYTDRVSTKSRTSTYLIDNQGPQLPQVKIDTQDPMENTTITLEEFPQDIGGAGVAKCHIGYTNSENKEVNYDILDNQLPRTSSIKALDKFAPDAQGVYTLKIRCEDRLGNKGDENIVKFPPIIDFSTKNKTIIKKDETFTGSFMIYSPSGSDIDEIFPDRTGNIGLSKITCKGTKDPNQSWEFSQGNRKISNMAGKNDKEHKITCSYEGKGQVTGTLKIEAKDKNNAQGESSQKFTLDRNPPAITIKPNQSVSSGDIELTITITDSIQLNTGSITIEGQPLNLDTCTEKKSEKLVCSYTITGPVKDKTITVTAQDAAGHKTTTESGTFTIDTEAPSITDPQMTYGNSGTLAKMTFTAQDTGVGLRTKTDQENTVLGFDWNAISYGFSENASCNNYQQEAILNPGMAEPFKLSFELTDSNHNGKYVCMQVKDKVGNLTSASLGQLKINQAPTLENSSATIAENLTVGSAVLTLNGSDPNGDDLTYEIVSGNTGSVFKIEDNELKVDGSLDYETLKNYKLEIKVIDQYGLSTTAIVTTTITDVDEEAPSIDTIANVSYPFNATITPIVLSGSDNSGDITKWEVKDLPAGLGFDEATHSITGTLAAPAGNYQITVIASDADGNKTEQKFTLTIQAKKDPKPEVKPGYSGGGGGNFSLKKDHCPNGDHSASYYDGSCGTQQNEKKPDSSDKAQTPVGEKKTYQENEIFNPSIEDGKCYNRRPHVGIFTSKLIPTSEEYNKAQSFLWSYEITKFNSVDEYSPMRNLSRAEAAKLFSQFATNVLCRRANTNLKISYTDINNVNNSLKPYIESAYQLGLMKGGGRGNGKFRPFDPISKMEVNAVLIRMILKAYLDESNGIWHLKYNKVSQDLNIISYPAGIESISRNDIALMLFRAYKNQIFDRKDIDYFSFVLQTRDHFLGSL